MLTLHLAESPFDRLQAGISSIEYLSTIGFLGPEVLAGHCVQVDAKRHPASRRIRGQGG